MSRLNFPKLFLAVAGSVIAGSSGALFTSGAVNSWYQEINKPWFNPPSWLFGPVWTLLFVLMGVAFYIVWMKGLNTGKGRGARNIFLIQFAFNIAWSWIFFGMGNFWLAFAEILILWWLIYKTIKSFSAVDKQAGMLLWPYLSWVSFATFLNLSIAVLN